MHLRGIDRDSLCIKFSKAYTALLGDGHTGLYREDSLERGRWPTDMKRQIKESSFDLVLTNPPFGRGLVKEGEILREFELGHKWKRNEDGDWVRLNELRKKQELGILFLELCLKLLKPGGRLGIVLLESHLGTVTDAYVGAWLLENYTVLGVVDLPDTTFQPHTHAKTGVLYIENSPPPAAYEILMGQARHVGHDSRGNTIFRQDEEFRPLIRDGQPVVADDLPEVQARLRALKAGKDDEDEYAFRVLNTDLQDLILIPRYYDRRYRARLSDWATAHDCELVSPKELVESGAIQIMRGHGGMNSQWYTSNVDDVPYVRTSNLSGLEIEYQSRHLVRVPQEIYERKSKKVRIKAHDILFVRRGEDRIGDVAIVYPGFERVLVAGEIDIIRVSAKDNDYGLDAYALLYLLSHPHVREQFWHKMFYETIIWNIADRWRDVLLPVPRDAGLVASISDRVSHIVNQRRQALEDMRDLYLHPVIPEMDSSI